MSELPASRRAYGDPMVTFRPTPKRDGEVDVNGEHLDFLYRRLRDRQRREAQEAARTPTLRERIFGRQSRV